MLSLVTLLAFVAAGCGGGGAPPAAAGAAGAAAPAGGAAAPAADGSAPAAGATGTDPNATTVGAATCTTPDPTTGTCPAPAPAAGEAPTQVTAPGNQVTASDASPKDFTKNVGKRVIVVMLYQPEAHLSDIEKVQVLKALAAEKKVDGVFLPYRASDYHIYTDIPEKLGLFGTPSIAIIDRAGKVQNFWIGFVDYQLLAKAIEVAGAVKPAAVTQGDAPPTSGGAKAVPNSAVPDPTTAAGSPAPAGAVGTASGATTPGVGTPAPAAGAPAATATAPAAGATA